MNPADVMDLPYGLLAEMEWVVREERKATERAQRIAKWKRR